MPWFDRLSRTTGSGSFIPEVDGLRCIAIGAVILHHVTASYLTTTRRLGAVDLPAHWWDLFPRSTAVVVGYSGYFGVNLFFVISGFILALPFVRSDREGSRRPHLGAYYVRRVVRLEAPDMINIAAAFLLIVLTNSGWRVFVPHMLASLFYAHGAVFGQASWVNGVAWSLEVEVQFYLVMPLLAGVFVVRRATLRRGLLVAGILATAWLATVVSRGGLHPRLQLSLCNYLQFFLAGFLLADLDQAHGTRPLRRLLRWDAAAVLSGAAIFVIITRRYDLFPLTPFLIAILFVGLFLGRMGHAVISRRAVVVIGGMCYTISPGTTSW